MVYTHKVEKPEEAGKKAAGLITSIAEKKPRNTLLHAALPGGRSILPILSEFKSLRQETREMLRFYLVDERVGGESNSKNLRVNFFEHAVAEGFFREEQFVYPRVPGDLLQPHMQDCTHLEKAVEDYTRQLPEKFDLIILGVGEDGHVASLFPRRRQNYDVNRVVLVEDSPKPPPERLTLTFEAFNRDAVVLLLFFGPEKQEALEKTLEVHFAGGHNNECPASYFLDFADVYIISDREFS